MPPVGGNRPACGIKCTDISDPTKTYEFGSLLQATKALMQWQQKNVGHSVIKRLATQKREAYGFKWELVDDNSNDEEELHIENSDTFTFRECVEGMFNGQDVRVTKDIPRRASVYDVIRVVTENVNPHSVFQRLCAENTVLLPKCDEYCFSGVRQRMTPVADAEGIMYIINLLPGRRATLFRMHAMNLLVRFLAGDQSLHEEIDANASAQDQLSDAHPLQIMTDAVRANPKSCKYMFKSPRMQGKSVYEFHNKCVVYLLVYTIDGKIYIKVGYSDDIRKRLDAHYQELQCFELYSVIAMDNAFRLEKAFKEKFALYNEELMISGKTKTEFFTGMTAEEAEDQLFELYHEMRLQNATDKQLEFEKMKLEMELKLRLAEMAHQLEMKKLELAIVQANKNN